MEKICEVVATNADVGLGLGAIIVEVTAIEATTDELLRTMQVKF